MELNLKLTEEDKVNLHKWAAITVDKFEYRVAKNNLVYSGDLLRSFAATVNADANGDKALISFAFNYYLRMLDMGVGKGVKRDDVGGSGRKKYNVFNKVFYAELMRLNELLTEQYAKLGIKSIAYNI